MTIDLDSLSFHPLTPERWQDFETLFGKNGACGGCWCMWWKETRSHFNLNKGEGNHIAMKTIVESGQTPGILAYVQGFPAGWCAIEPRQNYPGLERSRVLKPVDDQSVWSITCFFIHRNFRHRGLLADLAQAAVIYAADQGARIVEAYPVEPKNKKLPDVFFYTGFVSVFQQVGFVEVARRSENRPVMRKEILQK